MASKHKIDLCMVDEAKRLRPGHEAFKELGMEAPRGRGRQKLRNSRR